MSFRWRYEDAASQVIDGPVELQDQEFEDQTEAEAWFSDEWPALREAGVHQVVLLDGGAKVYGPMGLEET